MSHMLASEIPQCRLGHRCALPQNDEGAWNLAPRFIRDAYDGDLLDGGMPQQDTFYLDRRYVLPAADDHILEAIPDLHIAVGMNHCGISGVHPATIQRPRRGLRVPVVAFHHDVSANHDLSERCSVARHRMAVRTHYSQF